MLNQSKPSQLEGKCINIWLNRRGNMPRSDPMGGQHETLLWERWGGGGIYPNLDNLCRDGFNSNDSIQFNSTQFLNCFIQFNSIQLKPLEFSFNSIQFNSKLNQFNSTQSTQNNKLFMLIILYQFQCYKVMHYMIQL